ncbi:PREDICTED: uncharacterized protein LOC104598520 [Nelumbo nucifera]|uniref:Uncharacterized protein n=2 Tax=Nelumbo nucifera TaxID=4432 RepID=A0A822Z0H4_NELNU|nr:PREDICTED: uncharacterized protein LOC104598520 [Nelumbo nucifera]DAD34978.1 TPA_asm: hypothetical protein HUJ06_005618 [Nelumbo nucifera]
MVSSSYMQLSHTSFHIPPENLRTPRNQIGFSATSRPIWVLRTCNPISSSSSSSSSYHILRKSVPLAAAVALLFWSNPVSAGILSGFSGIESVPGPQLPQIDFLNRFNEENQKKYAELDERFKSSPILKKLLEQSKLNKEKNRREIEDKYCLRGAEWGVGVCSTEGMTAAEKENFITMLKQRAEPK